MLAWEPAFCDPWCENGAICVAENTCVPWPEVLAAGTLTIEGISVPNILRGIHESMAGRLVKLPRAIRAEGVVLLTGGLAIDEGLLKAMRDEVEAAWRAGAIEVRTHADGVHAGAIGAALWGAFRHEKLAARRISKELSPRRNSRHGPIDSRIRVPGDRANAWLRACPRSALRHCVASRWWVG